LLSGTFELFPLAEVLGLIERAQANGALVVRAREVDGTLYFVDGALCAGEIGDLSGPIEGRQALELRLLEVAVPLLRARNAEFEFRADVTPPWPAPVAIPAETVFEPARRIAREWSAIMTAIESFESVLERTGRITTDSITLSHLGFRVLELVDGHATIRELARRAGASLVTVGPEVRALVLAGAVRVLVDSERALATARAEVERDRPSIGSPVDVTGTPPDLPPVAPPLVAESPAAVSAPAPELEHAAVVAEVVAEAGSPAAPSGAPATAAGGVSDDLAERRAALAARAGLADPGPMPEPAEAPEPAPAERAEIVVDRSELLRMFSGLKDE
jgi:hypothetical protein